MSAHVEVVVRSEQSYIHDFEEAVRLEDNASTGSESQYHMMARNAAAKVLIDQFGWKTYRGDKPTEAGEYYDSLRKGDGILRK